MEPTQIVIEALTQKLKEATALVENKDSKIVFENYKLEIYADRKNESFEFKITNEKVTFEGRINVHEKGENKVPKTGLKAPF